MIQVQGFYPSLGIPLSTLPLMSIVRIQESGVAQDFYVVRHNAYSSGGTQLLRRYIHSDMKWHSSTVNAYATCTLDAWFNGTYFNLLPTAIQGQISNVSIPYSPGNGNYTITNLSCKVFALSGTELGKTDSTMNVEGTALANAASLVIATDGSTAKTQWTRSPDKNSFNMGAFTLKADGSLYGEIVTETRGARPAFVLPAATKLTDNGDGTYSLA